VNYLLSHSNILYLARKHLHLDDDLHLRMIQRRQVSGCRNQF